MGRLVLTKEEKAKLGEKGVCDRCGSEGIYCIDPFNEDINHIEILTCLCDKCYADTCMEV